MTSITDFKGLFDRYQEEVAKQGIPIAQYCQMNGIVYNQFERWYIESECIACYLTPDEIKKRRFRSDVTAVLNDLHDNATRILNDPHTHLSDMMEKALKYILNNWDGLLRYHNDGHYTIDNMPAERAIRPFTVNRNNTKFFSIEEGVKVAATLFTIVETARQSGVNVRDYLVYAIRGVMKGNKDCSTYTP